MRTFILLFFLIVLGFKPSIGISQNTKIKIDSDRTITVDEAFRLIQDQTNYSFIYRLDLFENFPMVAVKKGTISTVRLLDNCLGQSNVSYEFIGNTIILSINEDGQSAEYVDLPLKTIKGTVLDRNGRPFPGVNVVVVAKSNSNFRGISTDLEGKYSIEASKGNIIRLSYIGYISQEFIIETQSIINVVLEEETAELEEVVLVGYGTTKKVDLVGAVSSVDVHEMIKVGQSSIEASLAGRLAGVHVSRANGEPGAGAAVQIRGFSSFLGSNEPLYVIDGIPYHPFGSNLADVFNNAHTDKLNPLNFISFDDIERIDVLKDASSAGIYGSQAANGVILITTKRGKENSKLKMEISYRSSIESLSKKIDVLNRAQFLDVMEESILASGESFSREDYDLGGNTDWQEESVKTALFNELFLGFSGGVKNSKTTYATGLSLTDQEGILGPSEFKRYSGRIAIQASPLNNLIVGTNLNYSNTKRVGASANYFNIAFTRPDLGIEQEIVNSDPFRNYYYEMNLKKSENNSTGIFGSIFGELEIGQNLKFKSNFSFITAEESSESFKPGVLFSSGEGRRSDSFLKSRTLVWDNTISYNNSWNNIHGLNILAGASWQNIKSKSLSINSLGFPNDNILYNLGSANSISGYRSGETESGLSSFFLRTKYDFGKKYYITFTGRADRSTKFGPNNQWGYFPSGGIGWKISDEKFMENSPFDFLKLRVSTGITGLAKFPDFLYYSVYESGNFYNNTNGIRPTSLPNQDIRWEKTKQTDVGLEFRMFNSRFGGEIGYYEKSTSDLILFNPIPFELGAGTLQLANVGEVSNNGYEIELYGSVIDSENFSWDSNFNISFEKNKIEKISEAFLGITSLVPVPLKEGDSFGTILGYKTNGLIESQEQLDALNAGAPDGIYRNSGTGVGDRLFVDINEDGEITGDDRVKIGDGFPDFYGGFSNIFKFKSFELSTFFNFSFGAKGQPINLRTYSNPGVNDNKITNLTTKVLDAWSPDNPDGKWPRNILSDPNNNSNWSDATISDASYIRLKNVQLSYKLPLTFNATVFVSATNLFTITNWEGQDPEQVSLSFSGIGVNHQTYPFTRTMSIGCKLNF